MQIIRPPERGVRHHHHNHNQQRHQDVGGGLRQEQKHNRHHTQHDQHHAIVDRLSEEYERLVAEEVEEEPGGQHDDEDDERDRVPQQAEEEDEQGDDGVVHAEVGHVEPEARERVAEAVGEVEGAEVEHDLPGAAGAEADLDAVLGAGDVLRARGARRRRGGRDCAVRRHDLGF